MENGGGGRPKVAALVTLDSREAKPGRAITRINPSSTILNRQFVALGRAAPASIVELIGTGRLAGCASPVAPAFSLAPTMVKHLIFTALVGLVAGCGPSQAEQYESAMATYQAEAELLGQMQKDDPAKAAQYRNVVAAKLRMDRLAEKLSVHEAGQ